MEKTCLLHVGCSNIQKSLVTQTAKLQLGIKPYRATPSGQNIYLCVYLHWHQKLKLKHGNLLQGSLLYINFAGSLVQYIYFQKQKQNIITSYLKEIVGWKATFFFLKKYFFRFLLQNDTSTLYFHPWKKSRRFSNQNTAKN